MPAHEPANREAEVILLVECESRLLTPSFGEGVSQVLLVGVRNVDKRVRHCVLSIIVQACVCDVVAQTRGVVRVAAEHVLLQEQRTKNDLVSALGLVRCQVLNPKCALQVFRVVNGEDADRDVVYLPVVPYNLERVVVQSSIGSARVRQVANAAITRVAIQIRTYLWDSQQQVNKLTPERLRKAQANEVGGELDRGVHLIVANALHKLTLVGLVDQAKAK